MADYRMFQYGVNAIDMTEEYSKPRIVTGVFPYGQDGNGRSIRIDDRVVWHKKSVAKYGKVLEMVDFGRMTKKVIKKQSDDQTVLNESELNVLKTKLLSKAKRWIADRLDTYPNKITVKGIDEYYLGKYTSRTHIGDRVRCLSTPHNIDTTAWCLSMDIDYFDHQNDTYIIGPYIPSNFYDPKITKR